MSALPIELGGAIAASEYWNEIADEYPERLSLLYKKKKSFDHRLVVQHLSEIALGADAELLDAGCGKGGDAAYFAHRDFGRVVGVDHSQRMLASAIARIMNCHDDEICRKIELRGMDIRNLAFADETFRVSCSFSVIDHIRSSGGRAQAISQMIRVTEQNGLVVLTFPNTDALASRLRAHPELTVRPEHRAGHDVIVVEDRQSASSSARYDFEKTYSHSELQDVVAQESERLALVEITTGVMTECRIVRSFDAVEAMGELPDSIDILVDLTERPSARAAVTEALRQWERVPVALRGLRIGAVAKRR